MKPCFFEHHKNPNNTKPFAFLAVLHAFQPALTSSWRHFKSLFSFSETHHAVIFLSVSSIHQKTPAMLSHTRQWFLQFQPPISIKRDGVVRWVFGMLLLLLQLLFFSPFLPFLSIFLQRQVLYLPVSTMFRSKYQWILTACTTLLIAPLCPSRQSKQDNIPIWFQEVQNHLTSTGRDRKLLNKSLILHCKILL